MKNLLVGDEDFDDLVEAVRMAIVEFDDTTGVVATRSAARFRELYKNLTGKEFSYDD